MLELKHYFLYIDTSIVSPIQCTIAQWNLEQIAHKQLYRADIREYELYLGNNNTFAVFFQHFYFFIQFSSIQLFPNFSVEALR